MKQSRRERFYLWLERYPYWNKRLFHYDGIAPSGFDRYIHKKTGRMALLDDDFKVVVRKRYRGIQ